MCVTGHGIARKGVFSRIKRCMRQSRFLLLFLSGIYGGFLLGVRSVNGLAFYDWENTELIRRIEIQPKHVRDKNATCILTFRLFVPKPGINNPSLLSLCLCSDLLVRFWRAGVHRDRGVVLHLALPGGQSGRVTRVQRGGYRGRNRGCF